MGKAEIQLYTLEELKEYKPEVYKYTLQNLVNQKISTWEPSGDFYFDPPQEELEAAFRLALSAKAPLVFETYEEYLKAGKPEGGYCLHYSPFFRFNELKMVYDLYSSSYAGAVDLRETNPYVFKAYLGIPPRWWNALDISIIFDSKKNKNCIEVRIACTGVCLSDPSPEKYSRLYDFISTIEDRFDDILYLANKRLTEEFEWHISEERIIEEAELNGWKFDETGRLYW